MAYFVNKSLETKMKTSWQNVFSFYSLVYFWFVALIFLNHKVYVIKKKNKPPTDKDKCTLGSCTKCLKVKRNKKDKSFSINLIKKCKLIKRRLYLSLEGYTDLYY